MNKRLQCIVSHVPQGTGVIDVGTDHGYLPVALAKRDYPGHIFASDIREGPLSAAKRTAVQAGVYDRIAFLLCDGLSLCDPESIDTIVIAGMGGDTICGILDRAEWCMDSRYTLVLQPMTRAEVLRYWLVNNGFEICCEDLVEDAGAIYSVLVSRYGATSVLSDAELFTGSYSKIRELDLHEKMIDGQITRFKRMLQGMNRSDPAGSDGRNLLAVQILDQLFEMKENDDDPRHI